jgi:NAD(P)-dependent dehydrogenase (short-subunit alcohol dehydrogenase family)
MDEKTAIVTGAASGIGRATALQLAAEGATVIVADMDTDGGEATVEAIADSGGSAEFYELNVAELDRFEEVADDVASQHDGIDILVNNAGVLRLSEFQETSESDFDLQIAVNLKGVWNGCQAVVPTMIEQGGGAIVNTASIDGITGAPYHAPYGAAKAAVINLTRTLAVELGRDGIRINSVCPGFIETPPVEHHINAREDPEAKREAMASENALGRLGDPTEVAECIAFLASDKASFVTGEELTIDAGYQYQKEAHFRP